MSERLSALVKISLPLFSTKLLIGIILSEVIVILAPASSVPFIKSTLLMLTIDLLTKVTEFAVLVMLLYLPVEFELVTVPFSTVKVATN